MEKGTLVFLLLERRAHPSPSFFRIFSFQPHSPVKISSVIYIEEYLVSFTAVKRFYICALSCEAPCIHFTI
ncbi:hypothetical protein HMPREF0083_02400 [Aneurinibacillus aneurinilyticus ATCC 12856]|uniref:Uncharacterized protein n=1 Tax=Aneurinibacillus aneurinilyticus ATCC 12856 TaxID=649747 RepID=U1WLT4_ANEAE|nr:hypothetical protein HMPREF0083_02400 [Aneurinibacillus aneurinilyticus ATCC 12856]